MIYLLDSNVLITAKNQYYGFDAVPEYWDWLLHQAEQGIVKLPLEMYEEIVPPNAKKHPDDLAQWLSTSEIKSAIVFDEQVDAAIVGEVLGTGYGTDLTDSDVVSIGGDPFLIAYARVAPAERTVITVEVSAPKKQRQNRKVPDVCKSFGVTWHDPHWRNKELEFSTNWNKAVGGKKRK